MASIASTLPAAALARRSTKPISAALITTSQRAPGRIPKGRRWLGISCAIAQPETLKVVQNTIAKQLSIEESTVTAETKFADLGADSLDTVEIMMALEEKFGVSVGEGGAENIATVQDAADLIEKVKADAAA